MASACVNIGGCDVVQALVVTLVVIMSDEGRNVRFEITRCPAAHAQHV